MEKENNLIFAIGIALLIILLFGGAGMMGFGRGYGGMMSGYYGGFGFMWLFGVLIMILFVIALILFILWLIKQMQLTGNGRIERGKRR